jgi:hypothetical protein
MTVPMVFESHARSHPNKIAFIFEGKEWTFGDVSEFLLHFDFFKL